MFGGGETSLTKRINGSTHVAVPVHVPDVVAVPPPAVPVLPDPLVLVAPLWDVGVEKCDVAPTGKAKCSFCGGPILRNSARLVYYPAKSVIKYAHTGCGDKVPAAMVPHSTATLRYQRHFVAAPHVLLITDDIDEALSLFP